MQGEASEDLPEEAGEDDRGLPAVLADLPDRRGAPSWPDDLARVAPLQARVGRAFVRPALLRVALTHPTWVNEHGRSGWPSNACLEFFGDAVLALLAADALWRRFPGVPEGTLTRLRASLVSEPTLAASARAVGLGPLLWVGRGGVALREQDGALADAAEAVLGAAFLDARAAGEDPLRAAAGVFAALLGPRLAALSTSDGQPAKSRLQEWTQARWRRMPVYVQIGERPPADRPLWRARAELRCPDGQVIALGEGEGPSLRAAELAAAEVALARIARGELG